MNTKTVHDLAQNFLLPCKTCYTWTLPSFLTLPVLANIDLHITSCHLNCFPIIYNQILPTRNQVQRPVGRICMLTLRLKLKVMIYQILPIDSISNVQVPVRRRNLYINIRTEKVNKWGSVLINKCGCSDYVHNEWIASFLKPQAPSPLLFGHTSGLYTYVDLIDTAVVYHILIIFKSNLQLLHHVALNKFWFCC